MKRRTALAATAGLAAGWPAVPLAGARDDPDCDRVEEIVVAKSGDEPVATEEVPAPWWEQVERARDVHDEIREEYRDAPWYRASGRTAGEREICGRTEMAVVVYAADVGEARAALEDERDGVPITVKEYEEPEVALATATPDAGGENTSTGAPDDTPDGAPDETPDDTPDATPDADTESATDEAERLPGPGMLGALAGLAGAGYLAARRRADGSARQFDDR